MINQIEILCINFKHLSPRDKFIYLMSAEGDICKTVAKFIGDNLT